MSDQNPKQYAGVWFDNQHAKIITNNQESDNGVYTILEKIDSEVYKGDKGEHTKNNADRSNSLKYFKSVSSKLMHFDEILIFGPGKAQEELVNFLNDDSHFKSKKITIDSASKMTDPQMIAKVRDFFTQN